MAVARAFGKPHFRSILATGNISAVSKMATATGINTSERYRANQTMPHSKAATKIARQDHAAATCRPRGTTAFTSAVLLAAMAGSAGGASSVAREPV